MGKKIGRKEDEEEERKSHFFFLILPFSSLHHRPTILPFFLTLSLFSSYSPSLLPHILALKEGDGKEERKRIKKKRRWRKQDQGQIEGEEGKMKTDAKKQEAFHFQVVK